MTEKYVAHQMGIDKSKQPIIGIFEDGKLVARLSVKKIADLWKKNEAKRHPGNIS